MIIVCPECATRYTVKPDSFNPNGRTVRCTKCSNTWFQKYIPEDVLDLDAPSPGPGPDNAGESHDVRPTSGGTGSIDVETEAARLLKASRRTTDRLRARARKRRGNLRGWLLLTGSLAAAIVLAVQFRVPVVRTLPTVATLYAAVGLPVNVRGMEFRNLATEQQFENGMPVLAIRGEIVNISPEPKSVPRLRFSLRDGARQELYHWSMNVRKEPLNPDEAVPFVARLASPPSEAQDIQVRFARQSDTGAVF